MAEQTRPREHGASPFSARGARGERTLLRSLYVSLCETFKKPSSEPTYQNDAGTVPPLTVKVGDGADRSHVNPSLRYLGIVPIPSCRALSFGCCESSPEDTSIFPIDFLVGRREGGERHREKQ